MLDEREIENISKGFANHWRIKVLFLLGKNKASSLDYIVETLEGNFKTLSVHVSKLSRAGLVKKEYKGRTVLHTLTKRGKAILTFCRMLE